MPSLLKSLRDGLASAAIDPFVTSEFFSKLESVHVQAFQRFKREVAEPQPVPPSEVDSGAAEVQSDSVVELGAGPLLELPPQELEEIVEAPAMVEVVEEISTAIREQASAMTGITPSSTR